MKAHLFLLTACLSLTAADLGVIDPSHGILLNSNTTRPDFQSFQVELKPSDTTNTVTLTITNRLLTVEDMAALPSGRIVMGLRSRFPEGLLSGLALYTFDLRRADPPVPSAERVALSGPPEPPKPLINEMERLRGAVPVPPIPSRTLPGHPEGNYFSTNIANWRPDDITELMSRTNPITWNPADYTNQEPDTRIWTDVNIRFFQVPQGDATYAAIDPTMATNLAYCWYRLAYNVNCQSTNHDHEVVEFGPRQFILKAKPLPNSTNQSYAEYLDWLADRKGKRRNE